MKKKWTDFIDDELKRTGVSRAKIANHLGVSVGAVGHWLNQNRETNFPNVPKMLGLVGQDAVLLYSDGSLEKIDNEQIKFITKPKANLIPVMGDVVMEKDGTLTLTEEQTGFIKAESQDPDSYAFKVKGSTAEPRIKSGEFILVEPNATVDNGDDVLVIFKSGDYAIKTFDYMRDGEYRFSSVNQSESAINVPTADVKAVHLIAGTFHRSRFISKEEVESKK